MNIVVTTDRGAALLLAAEELGGWVTPQQLAVATGKREPSPHDRDLLERLVTKGVLEKREPVNQRQFGRKPAEYRLVNG